MTTKIQLRRGSASQWAAADPTLYEGEIGIELDTNKMKVGNGSSTWAQLPYMNVVPSDFNTTINGYVQVNDIGAAGGVVGLDGLQNVLIPNDSIIFEGATADSYQLTLQATDPTEDRTIILPNASGTIALTSDISSAVSSLIDGAPGLLDTLNELAAAINDDPSFFTTIATNLSNHESDTTNVHGIADTSALATKTYADNAASSAQSNSHNYTDSQINALTTSDIEEGSRLYYTDERAQDAIGLNLGTGLTYTDSTGEIKVTPNTYDAYGAASTAQTAAEGYADNAILTEVTNRNNAIATAKSEAISTAEGYTDSQINALTTSDIEEGTNLYYTDERAQDAIGLHLGTGLTYTDSTGEIKVTPNTYDAYGAASTVDSNLSTHISDTITHGTTGNIVGTSDSQTLTNKTINLSNNTISGTIAQFNSALSDADFATKQYVDDQTTADITENTNLYFTDERAQDAVGNALGTGLSYNDSTGAISVTPNTYDTHGAADSALASANLYTDGEITTALNTAQGYANTAESNANTYTNNAITNLVNAAPNTLDTLKELADAIGDDPNFAVTVAGQVADAQTAANGYTDSAISTEVTNRNNAIATAKSQAISASELYADGLAVNYDANGAANAAETAANLYTDGQISTEVTNRNSAITTAINALTTSDIEEGTNLYYTDERAQDAIGLNLGTGLTYTDSTGEIKVTPNTYDAYGAASSAQTAAEGYADNAISTHNGDTTNVHGIADTAELATKTYADSSATTAKNDAKSYADGLISTEITNRNSAISAITTTGVAEGTNLYYTDERAQDAIGLNLGNGLSYDDPTGVISNSGVLSISGTSNEIVVDNSTGTVTIGLPDNVTIAQKLTAADVEISGALTFTGTATQIDVTNYAVEDSLIYLATAQYSSDLLDIGLFGAYGSSGNTSGDHPHAGFFRDATDGKWKLISGAVEPSDNIIDLTGATYDTLKLGVLEGNVTGNLTGNVTGDVSGNAGTVTNGVYTTDTGTVTNTMLAGSIANNKLSNSSVTVGTTTIALGSSSTSLAGITTINSTTIPTSKTLVVTTDKLSVHASTSSSELAGIISDETGSGSLVFGTSPTLKGNVYFQSAGGAGGLNNYIITDNSTGTLTINSGYPLNLTASGNVVITPTGGSAKVGSDIIATLTATQTLTGKTISGANNTLSNIGNSSLTNSKVTIGSTDVSLGSTATTLAGLSSVTSTSFVGALTGNADTVTNGVYTTDTATVTNTMLAGSISNSKLSNSSISINGNSISLGGSISGLATNSSPTFTGIVTLPLTTGGYVTTTSGGVISSVATIPNSGLTNSSISINGTSVALGGSISGLATTSDVTTAINNLVNGAPTALDTLKELADAINNDASYASSITTALGNKVSTLGGSTIIPSAGTVKGLVIKSDASQSVNLQEWQDSSGTALASINTSGQFVGDGSQLTGIVSLPSQTGNDGKYLTTDGETASWANLVVPISVLTGSLTTTASTTIDTIALSAFTSVEYTISMKQGTIVRTSKVIMQTDGTNLDMSEFGITETGGTMADILVESVIYGSNAVLQITVSDADITNVDVKLSKVAL